MKRARQFAIALALWGCFAQLLLPMAHAALMASPAGMPAGWCGDPVRAQQAQTQLPPELRDAQDPVLVMSADHCALLCAAAIGPGLLAEDASQVRPVGATARIVAPLPAVAVWRDQSPTPPSQGPPARS